MIFLSLPSCARIWFALSGIQFLLDPGCEGMRHYILLLQCIVNMPAEVSLYLLQLCSDTLLDAVLVGFEHLLHAPIVLAHEVLKLGEFGIDR